MKHEVSDLIINQFTRSLKSLRSILIKTKHYASERKFDENNFLQLRLAPDMFPFVRQVQIASDIAKASAARLTGKAAPSFPDDEKTIDQLLERIDRTVGYISEFKSSDFDGYQNHKISFPWNPGAHLKGDDYLSSHALPNFYFHMTTAYNILRLHGLPLGKGDYLGEQNWQK